MGIAVDGMLVYRSINSQAEEDCLDVVCRELSQEHLVSRANPKDFLKFGLDIRGFEAATKREANREPDPRSNEINDNKQPEPLAGLM